jgi:hypothetical protein
MAEFIILDQTGDTRMSFDTADDAAAKSCAATFAAMQAKGYWAAAEYADSPKRMIRAFDRTATRITMHPQLIGG